MKKVLLMGVLASFMLASCGTAKSPEMKRLGHLVNKLLIINKKDR